MNWSFPCTKAPSSVPRSREYSKKTLIYLAAALSIIQAEKSYFRGLEQKLLCCSYDTGLFQPPPGEQPHVHTAQSWLGSLGGVCAVGFFSHNREVNQRWCSLRSQCLSESDKLILNQQGRANKLVFFLQLSVGFQEMSLLCSFGCFFSLVKASNRVKSFCVCGLDFPCY